MARSKIWDLSMPDTNKPKVEYFIKNPTGFVGPYGSKKQAQDILHVGDVIIRRKIARRK